METKSRYEVIADLEKQKRDLIREKESINDQEKNKERAVTNLKRQKEDISKMKEDFILKQERDKKDFDFKVKNTEIQIDRQITDAEEELNYFKSTSNNRIETIKELIKGVDESLERFTKLQQEKK